MFFTKNKCYLLKGEIHNWSEQGITRHITGEEAHRPSMKKMLFDCSTQKNSKSS